MSNQNPNAIEDVSRKREPAPVLRPATLPAPDGPLVQQDAILAYARRVVVENSATPASPAAVLARELLAARAKLEDIRLMLGGVDQTLLRARTDVRRTLDT